MNTMKICTKCKVSKNNDCFRYRKISKDGLNSWCLECESVDRKDRYNRLYKKKKKILTQEEVENKKKSKKVNSKKRMLKYRYDLTMDEYEKMYESQERKCQICEVEHKLGGFDGLYVDHCHESNKVRGLLCNKCNSSLGKFNDSIEVLKKAIEYLDKYKN